jgi:hypothetical protein
LLAAVLASAALGDSASPSLKGAGSTPVSGNGVSGSDEEALAAEALAADYVHAFLKRERLQSTNASLEKELQRLQTAGRPDSPDQAMLAEFGRMDDQTRQSMAEFLDQNAEPVSKSFDGAANSLDHRLEEVTNAWQSVRASLDEQQLRLFTVGGSRRTAGQLAALLSVDKRWFWLFGLVAVLTLAGVVFHERRHEIRRLLNGGRARAMGLSKFLSAAALILAALTVITFYYGDRIYESLLTVGSGRETSPREAISRQNAAMAAQIAPLERKQDDLQRKYEAALAAGEQRIAAALPARSTLPADWKKTRQRALEFNTALDLLDRVPRAMQADLDELAKLSKELDAQTEATATYKRLRQWIRGGLGSALVGLAVSGGWLFYRGVRVRREVSRDTCPLCLGVDHLEPAPDYGRRADGPRDVAVVQCKNVISEEPYEQCDYTFMEIYRSMTKVCFPTLGVPQAGKTHWLAMLYWELNRGNYPKSVQFEKIRSQSSQDFDVLVEEILNSRIGTAATQRDRIPHPLVFNLQDRDVLGRNNLLVNIFDYSGEVTSDMGVEDYRRRRALEGDGFFFFLDPTYPSEPQSKALADFREDIRLVKGIKAGRRVRIPVALCVSKIDLLAGKCFSLPGGGDAIAWFYKELGRIDPTGEAMTWDVIEARSRLLGELRDTIWPGWEIERQIDDLFGGRYLFFPLTPVGLDGAGEADLSLRTISPFGLLEPLLWLLEMNGYPVLC